MEKRLGSDLFTPALSPLHICVEAALDRNEWKNHDCPLTVVMGEVLECLAHGERPQLGLTMTRLRDD